MDFEDTPLHTCLAFKTLQTIKDWMLILIVLVVVGIEMLIHIVGTAVPEATLNATLVPDELNPKGIDVRNTILQYHVCKRFCSTVVIVLAKCMHG